MIAVLASVFLAAAVEVTEMAIVVVGVGTARGWRSTLIGAGAGFGILVVLVAALGGALTLIPIDAARVVIGALLLTFGLQWLRKGILRVAERGFRGGGEEDEEVPAEQRQDGGGIDWTAFVLSFKGVLLEGLEVAFIVVAFAAGHGGKSGYFGAVIGAVAAFLVIGTLSLVARSRLEAVPGRSLKFGVGCLLSTFGTFWALEGLGVAWPHGDLSLLGILALYLGAAFAYLGWVRGGAGEGGGPISWIVGFGRFWYRFIIGDDWVAAAGVAVLLGGTWLLLDESVRAFWFGPLVVIAVVGVTLRRALTRAEDG